jgi:hypothetical protein
MLLLLVCPQATAEPAVVPALTPVARAVGPVRFEQQRQALAEAVAALQPGAHRSPLTRLSDHCGSLPEPREAGRGEPQ